LTSGWNYYKANYLMSTGLIMQMSGQGVNTTTAVSEGIGYGLLLALINNDQTTFNKIFAGANQYMWNSSHNSYFNWKIVNGGVSGTGAATDAELDICMALIFADKLHASSVPQLPSGSPTIRAASPTLHARRKCWLPLKTT
jgi:endo-1,4-beta-D-glucanase Y